MSFVEGIRVDIYFLGIIILKMLGKMRIEEGDKLNMTSLLQIPDISVFYRNECLSEEMINFLDVCFYDPQITLSELVMHKLISIAFTQSESTKIIIESPNSKSHLESSKNSGTNSTSKILKRYLTNGTNEGSSSEFYSETTSNFLRTSIDTFKEKHKIQSVLYEDSSYILKRLMSMKKRKTEIEGLK